MTELLIQREIGNFRLKSNSITMRKTLLFAAFAAFSAQVSAQTVLFEDDFEGYSADQGIAAQGSGNGWQMWANNNPAFDANVSSAFASSGSNSVHLLQTSTDDIVYDFGTAAMSGKYDIEFKMYIPAGKEGYFNVLHNWSMAMTYEWAVDVYFSAAGQVTWTSGAADGGSGTFSHNAWTDVKVAVDMDADQGKLYINGTQLHTWQWSLNNANGMAGLNQLRAVNFFAYGPSQTNGEYYIDDFKVTNSTGVSVKENVANSVTIFPNPANQVVNIDLTGYTNATITLFAMDGRVIDRFQTTSSALTPIQVSHLTNGIYFVEIVSGKTQLTRRLVVQH